MPPLLPSESKAYKLAMPEHSADERLNLNVRTGAALTFTRSAVVAHGGVTQELGIPKVTIPLLEREFAAHVGQGSSWERYLSNEIFYLNIVTRLWSRLALDADALRPSPRLFHSITSGGKSLYLFGGLIADTNDPSRLAPSNELWEFKIDTNRWVCLDDGINSGTVSRFDHTILTVDYVSPADQKHHPCVAITGGRGELNQELMHISIFDLESKQYINNTEMQLTLNELKPRNDSVGSGLDPRSASIGQRVKLKVAEESSFVITGLAGKNEGHVSDNNTLLIFSQEGVNDENLKNPIVSLPVSPNASGLRLPMSTPVNTPARSVVPHSLSHPTGGVFGSNIVVSGINTQLQEYQVHMFNRPSEKWCRLSIDSNKKAHEMYLWRSFMWQSHHRVLIIGSSTLPKGAEYATIQKFDMILLVALPVMNVFHGFEDEERSTSVPIFNKRKKTTTFEAYSNYIAPTSKIYSVGSVFPSYAVALGRSAFERFGSSLSDFEFVSADGAKVNVPMMLLRTRWGRCFDMLLAKAYARAVYKLEGDGKDSVEDAEADNNSLASGNTTGKKSVIMLNKVASSQCERSESPQFRLPFQEKLSGSSPATPLSSGTLFDHTSQSRKQSVVSQGSIITSSTSELPESPDFDNIPPMQPHPVEPLPPLDTKAPLKSFSSRTYLRDSPRGSVSGASIGSSGMYQSPSIKLKDLKNSVTALKKRGTSRSSSVQNQDEDVKSQLDSDAAINSEDSKEILEPLLIPRSLYLPFSTATVQALTEFLFTGQLGDKWLLAPTTTDVFLLSKFYELPLLYDLISEVLYSMIGKKETALMQQYIDLVNDFNKRLDTVYRHDQARITAYTLDNPHVKSTFEEIETYLNTVDDGYFNLNLLRKASKVSSFSSVPGSATRQSMDMSRRRSSARAQRLGKSSLSKEVKDLDDDDIDAEDEDDVRLDEGVNNNISPRSSPIQFRTDSMSRVSLKKVEIDDDNIDPLSKTISNAIDDDLISPKNDRQSYQSNSDSSGGSGGGVVQVAEGEFKLTKDQMKIADAEESSSSQNEGLISTNSDSDQLGVGLGLVNDLTMKPKKKGNGQNQLDEDDGSGSDVPNLENLASPNSAAPDDHLMKIIFETASLACDMKLLLRCTNALEISKLLKQKRQEFMTELDTIQSDILAEELEHGVVLKQQESDLRELEREGLERSWKERGPELQREQHDHEDQASGVLMTEQSHSASTSYEMTRGDSGSGSASLFHDDESINSKKTLRSKIPMIRSFTSISAAANRKPSTVLDPVDSRSSRNQATQGKKKFLGFIPRRGKE